MNHQGIDPPVSRPSFIDVRLRPRRDVLVCRLHRSLDIVGPATGDSFG